MTKTKPVPTPHTGSALPDGHITPAEVLAQVTSRQIARCEDVFGSQEGGWSNDPACDTANLMIAAFAGQLQSDESNANEWHPVGYRTIMFGCESGAKETFTDPAAIGMGIATCLAGWAESGQEIASQRQGDFTEMVPVLAATTMRLSADSVRAQVAEIRAGER